MTTLQIPPAPVASPETLADRLERLGGISPSRIRMRPAPGIATEADVITIKAREKRLFELIDGVLVEKVMGYRESLLAISIATALSNFVKPRKLGAVSGADGMMRLLPGLVRIPDVAYVSREHFPEGKISSDPIPSLVPDLAVEVLSESNTQAEMKLKRMQYFSSGARLVWLIDLETRTASVFTSTDQFNVVREGESLDGSDVLPGFKLPLQDIFAALEL